MSIQEKLWHTGANVPNHPHYDPTNEENVQRMYTEYLGYDRLIPLATVGIHGLISRLIKPAISSGIHIEKQADGYNRVLTVEQAAEEWLDAGKALIVIADHQHYTDHFVDVAGMRSANGLKRISDEGRPLAKTEYFDRGKDAGWKGRAISLGYRIMGAIPIYRPKDLERIIEPVGEFPVEIKKRTRLMRDTLSNTTLQAEAACISHLGEGGILHIYPEGQRKRKDWSNITEPGDLAARLLKQAEEQGIEVAVLVMARSYGVTREHTWRGLDLRHPHLRYEALLKGPFSNKTETNKKIQNTMQTGLDRAHLNKRAVGTTFVKKLLRTHQN